MNTRIRTAAALLLTIVVAGVFPNLASARSSWGKTVDGVTVVDERSSWG